jgi:hypothetical protein
MATVTLRRFIIGYSMMIILMVAICGYSVFQLGKLSRAAHVALNVEQQMIDDAGRLADVFLSEVRYAGKFAVTQAPGHYEQHKQFAADFDRYMKQLKTFAAQTDAAQRLSRVEEYHVQYNQLFEREVQYIKKKQPYAETRYREEKERLIDYLLKEQEAFKSDVQNSLQRRIGYIEKAAQQSQNLTFTGTLFLTGLGIGLAYWLAGKFNLDWIGSIGSKAAALALRLRALPNWKEFGGQK